MTTVSENGRFRQGRASAIAALSALTVLGAFMLLSVLAPLSSAAIAPGFVGVETQRKTIQHLEGGIIAKLPVKEGDTVQTGQLVMMLESTIARSTYDLLEGQFIDLLAEQARLLAERSGQTMIDRDGFPVRALNPARADEALRVQNDLLRSRQRALETRKQVLQQRIRSLEEQVRGFQSQEVAAERQIEILEVEERAVTAMVRQGLEREPRKLALQRAAAEIAGSLGEIRSRIAQAEIRVGETMLEMQDLDSSLHNQITGDLRDLSGRIADMEPRLRAAGDTLKRLDIRSPVNGTVVSLQYHTIGGVVRPGSRIMDVVPSDAEFLIEAQVHPTDIDVVRPGLPAEVRLSAFATRMTPTVAGEVVHVSADRLADEGRREYYYAIHVRLKPDDETVIALAEHLYPGMPVEVMVLTGERTVLDYFVQPVVDTFSRAMRER